jgi:hypothetical protein
MDGQQPPVVIVEDDPRGCVGKGIAIFLALFSTVWLLNFTVGIFEIPDVLPFVGNLDETAAAWLLFSSLNYLGIHLLPDPNRATRFTLQGPKEK